MANRTSIPKIKALDVITVDNEIKHADGHSPSPFDVPSISLRIRESNEAAVMSPSGMMLKNSLRFFPVCASHTQTWLPDARTKETGGRGLQVMGDRFCRPCVSSIKMPE